MQKSLGLLIVDDEHSITQSLNRIFHRSHYRIFTATSGAEGLECLAMEDIAIVISDMRMPEMSGPEFLQQVAKRWPDTIRIVLTGYADTQEAIRVINTGDIFRYIHKPWERDELLAIVTEAEEKYKKKHREKNQLETAVAQSHQLTFYNQQLKKTVEDNNAKLERTSDKLAIAQEDEKKLRQERVDAEKLSEAKSRFLATMSHEIRSPLNSIIAMNALLLDSELSNEQRELAKLAHDGGQALLVLINDILDFSKIEAGKLQLNQQWFNIIELIENTVELITTQAIDKPIELVTVISPDVPNLLLGDQVRVRQILINILSNAVKFTEQGGIIIRVQPVELGIHISVEDTGIGIPENRQKTIFEEFVQADNSDSRSYGGTGLGLSICKQLIQMMGGDISLSSKEGVGSYFQFSLPLQTKSSTALHPVPTNDHLVGIDSQNPILGEALKEQLMLFGYHVVPISQMSTSSNNYKKFSFIVDLNDVNKSANKYKEILNRSLVGNDILSSEPWTMVGLIPNDGLDQLNRLKEKGFTHLLRKPVRLENLLRYINGDEREYVERNSTRLKKEPLESQPATHAVDDLVPILLVEDSQANQAVVKAVLKNKGYSIDIANNGEEAVEKARENTYHIILMDLAMPVMDGLTATRYIRSEEGANKQTTIIAMTANAFAEDRERCVDAGMNDYISKPIDVRQFVDCLHKWKESVVTPNKQNKKPPVSPSSKNKYQFFDINILDQLVSDISEEALPKILDLFFGESEKRVPAMYEFYRQQAWQKLGDEAHTLKSGAGNFGAKQLQNKAEAIEVAVREKDYTIIDKEMLTLNTLLQNTIQELTQYGR